MSDLWSDRNPEMETLNSTEFNLREDIQCLKEEIQRLRRDIATYLREEYSDKFILAKGEYKPELEKLVIGLGWATEYGGDSLLVEPPKDTGERHE